MLGVAQVTYGMQPLPPEGQGWATKGHHILTSSIMSRGGPTAFQRRKWRIVEFRVLKQRHSLSLLTDLDDVWSRSRIKGQQGHGSAYKLLRFFPQSSY